MQLVGRLHHAATAIFLLFGIANTRTITTAPKALPTAVSTQTCESRTINYITDSLPQLCLKSTWAQASGTASRNTGHFTEDGETSTAGLNTPITGTGHSEGQNATSIEAIAGESATRTLSPSHTSSETAEASPTDIEEPGELNDAAFLSFEEWKKLILEKSGQQNSNIGGKRSGENRHKDSESFQNNLDSLGEEGEIDLDFGAFKTGRDVVDKSDGPQTGESNTKQENLDRQVKKKDHYRSKDAGKTCKERNSYASFDVGAKIVKTHHGAKNAKAVLVENKDSYMLSECTTNDKFLIIELSEDIWIDTVVLANYEFFSSMIKNFRVSLSDKWPVKTEKWKVVGTYEARNSREIQAFLIENPQIWARYIRIEFLTHYGTEYYCPLSLVRVHGTRMLESWKETEANNDEEEDDESEEVETIGEDGYVPDAVADTMLQEQKLQADLREAQAAIENLVKEAEEITATFAEPSINATHLGEINASLEEALIEQMSTPWIPDFDFGTWMNVSQGIDICLLREAPTVRPSISSSSVVETVASITGYSSEATPLADIPISNNTVFTTAISPHAEASTSSEIASVETSSVAVPTSSSAAASSHILNVTTTSTPSPSPVTPTPKTQNQSSSAKTKASSTQSSSSSVPTQQESFFKAVSRRLQLLESNSTLSLKYIEEQSRTLREAFSKVEKKQVQKTTTFLDTINSTLFTELKQIRQQYDEIWQSTVISLESQREESKKEILAITTRLNILADEVVFQKRMSIVQSVLLLLCLGLVIFSRVSTSSPNEYPLKSRFLNFSIESPTDISIPGSPEYIMPEDEMPNGRHEWVGNGHARQRSDDSIVSLEERDERQLEQFHEDESPPTPISAYSHSEPSPSPPSENEASSPPHFPVPSSPTTTIVQPTIPIRISSYNDGSEAPVRSSSDSKAKHQSEQGSPVQPSKNKRPFIRQQKSPPAEETTSPTNGISHSSPPVVPPRTHLPQAQNHNHRNAPVSPETQGRNRRRNGSSGSFSIARKPLPALPNDG